MGALSLRVQQLNVQCETKTKDNVFVVTRIAVQYEVHREDAYQAYYKLTDPRGQITSYVFDVVRSYIPRIDLDDVFTTKEEIAQVCARELCARVRVGVCYGRCAPRELLCDDGRDTQACKESAPASMASLANACRFALLLPRVPARAPAYVCACAFATYFTCRPSRTSSARRWPTTGTRFCRRSSPTLSPPPTSRLP